MSGCGGNCKCGSSCSCGDGCTCGRSADISENGTTTQILIVGVAPAGSSFERSEMSFGSENDGCKCGSNCSCDPCTCK